MLQKSLRLKISEKVSLALLVLINIPTPPKPVCCIFFLCSLCDSVPGDDCSPVDAIKINAKHTR